MYITDSVIFVDFHKVIDIESLMKLVEILIAELH